MIWPLGWPGLRYSEDPAQNVAALFFSQGPISCAIPGLRSPLAPATHSMVLSRLGQLAIGMIFLICISGCPRSQPRIVLYCAQDKDFAEENLDAFTRQHGIVVAPKYDTEADKSISLYFELLNEKDRPRCELFSNNEILATIRLQR